MNGGKTPWLKEVAIKQSKKNPAAGGMRECYLLSGKLELARLYHSSRAVAKLVNVNATIKFG